MKRLGKVESYKVKQVIFLGLLVLLVSIVWLSIARQEQVIPLIVGAAILGLIIFLVSKYDFLLTLKEYERAVVFRFGRVVRVGGPGWAFLLPIIESFRLVDLRTHTVDIPPQQVITKDKVALQLDAVIYLFVKPDNDSVIKSVIEVRDFEGSAVSFVQASIRDASGNLTFPELVSNIGDLNIRVKQDLETIAKEWGVTVESVQMSEVKIPKELEEALTHQKAAEQQKLARAELALASGLEIDAIRKATEQLDDRSLAYYYIRALEKLGEGKSTKFIFPLELMRLASRLGDSVKASTQDSSEWSELLKKYLPEIQAMAKESKKAKEPVA